MYQDKQIQKDQMQPFLIETPKFHSIIHLFMHYLNNHNTVPQLMYQLKFTRMRFLKMSYNMLLFIF